MPCAGSNVSSSEVNVRAFRMRPSLVDQGRAG